MDEEFFFLYHLKLGREQFMKYPVRDRKYLINKFIEQKNKENDAIEAAKKRVKK